MDSEWLMGQQLMELARQAHQAVKADVDDIIQHGDRDTNRIEHLLDLMLGFCYDTGVLIQFKRLCRYYLTFDPVATVSHVYAYRDMWGEDAAYSAGAGRARDEF